MAKQKPAKATMLPDLECTTPQLEAILGVVPQTITNYVKRGTRHRGSEARAVHRPDPA
jgi:hypothetical protein